MRKAAEPFHFQATRLGQYLIATNEGPRPAGTTPGGTCAATCRRQARCPGCRHCPAAEHRRRRLRAPSESGDWEIAAAGPTPTRRRREGCATWPEIETNTSGSPRPCDRTTRREVEGFFEAHVHGMAFEFLGGRSAAAGRGTPTASSTRWATASRTATSTTACSRSASPAAGPEEPVTDYDPVGWPTFELLAGARHPEPRAVVLALARARLPRRAAPDRQPAGRQRRAVRALPRQAQLVQRDGRGAPAGPAPVRAAGLHRRAGRRPRPGLVPDRDLTHPGARGDQRRAAGGRDGHRDLRAVRLPRVSTSPCAPRRRSTSASTRCSTWASARCS
jgi:hypothetical protein